MPMNAAAQQLEILATRPLWEDHFHGPAGRAASIAYTDTPLEQSPQTHVDVNWRPDIGDGSDGPGAGWGNGEAEYYVNNALQLDGSDEGCLVVTARRTTDAEGLDGWRDNPHWQYLSGKITTAGRVSFEYGLIEARIKAPTDPGSWSAFWMLGDGLLSGVPWPQCGEIDILESVGQEPEHLLGTIHGPGYCGDGGVTQKIHAGVALSEEFHTYSVLWLPDSITWFFDGTQYHRLTPADIGGNEWVFNQPFYVVLNLAMGGTLGGALHESVAECRLVVDYVRHSAVQMEEDGPFIGSVRRH